jgi:pyruvate dehydrogenase E2 component (dihydrolipoamide acetyltransferase)
VVRDLDTVGESSSQQAIIKPATQAPSPTGVAIPVSMMRKTIAKRLLAAKNDAPHFYLTVSADLTSLSDWRVRLNSDPTVQSGSKAKVSVNDLVVLAVSRALQRHPMVNSSWQGDFIQQHKDVHVALAVALPEGLVTPVIRDTDRLGVRDIAARARDLAEKAKGGKLGNDDFTGGTFTVSNLGMFGIEEFTAIINPPQAAILAVGAALPTPWVDKAGNVVVRQRVKMTMSCDHRVVDGAVGAAFLKTLVEFLEDPTLMLV